MGRSTEGRQRLSEQKKQYRSWTAEQKIAIVLAGLRGDRSVKEVCREHQISDTLFYSWRDKLLEGGVAALTRQKLGRAVNRKRVLRVMRERKLIQRRRPLQRRKRPGFFRVERPRQLWQLDMTS